MIRRNPTLIPLGDADVNDVKELIIRRKLAAADKAAARDAAKKKDDKKGPHVAPDDAKRKRDAMTRDDRLGVR